MSVKYPWKFVDEDVEFVGSMYRLRFLIPFNLGGLISSGEMILRRKDVSVDRFDDVDFNRRKFL